MDRRGWTSRWLRRLLVPVVGVMVALAGTLPAHARTRPQPLVGWIRYHAAPISTVDPAAPLQDLEAHLVPVDWRGDPFAQLGWYTQLTVAEQRQVIAHARAVYDLVRALPAGPSVVGRADAVQHAHALLGFYEAYGPDGDATDVRDRTVERRLAGGRLRRQLGHRHVSLVDHVLGQARHPDYLLDLHHDGPPAVRRWLRGPAKMRIIGSAYVPADDADYAITVDSWRGAFDAVLHVDRVTASRLLAAP